MKLTFGKNERLCSRRTIDWLYSEGNRLSAFPFRVQWLPVETDELCQVMIVAPKRKFHHAVDRNRVRRLARECYRRLKPELYDTLRRNDMHLALSLVYVHTEILTYEQMMRKMTRLIGQLCSAIEAR